MNAFKEKTLYHGVIRSQRLEYGKNDVAQLVLEIPLDGEVINARNPEHGVTPLTHKAVAEVFLRFPEDNPEQLGYAIKDLAGLGFSGEDLEVLNPASGAKFHNFAGKEVYVTPRHQVSNDREITYWNLRNPKKFENKAVAKGKLGSKSSIGAAYREALKKSKEDEAATSKQHLQEAASVPQF